MRAWRRRPEQSLKVTLPKEKLWYLTSCFCLQFWWYYCLPLIAKWQAMFLSLSEQSSFREIKEKEFYFYHFLSKHEVCCRSLKRTKKKRKQTGAISLLQGPLSLAPVTRFPIAFLTTVFMCKHWMAEHSLGWALLNRNPAGQSGKLRLHLQSLPFAANQRRRLTGTEGKNTNCHTGLSVSCWGRGW